MKIVICGSIKFRKEMVEYRDKLNDMGHEGIICPVMEELARGERPELMAQIEKEHWKAKKEGGFIKWYYGAIVESDAILVLNFKKGDIENYIGGNTLMEIAFAHVYNKKVFLLNPVPEISYKDELLTMTDKVLNGDLSGLEA
ncbi:hypothetical protein A2Y83_00285 [Candidatus Falkowbacteria bacterium RBG_13_39_14]|uniref:Nucleoside 2-deoxyribosyltransferase n=1 Tax=Candidatus Falkowbacteria bacterium RBG_13_39_14 TaxID=1797985 RepID=A0A1F5S4H4_9BACT|nr:MAG: hypothetical protein A2Y83_00285 [Candidatus Falkowbacteria bacterium RBG_13_39_14]